VSEAGIGERRNGMKRILGVFRGDALRARAIRGSMLTVVSFGGQNALRLGSNLILTRLLFPEAFGLMALVQVFMTGLQMFSDLGVNASVIRSKRGEDQGFLDTAWTVQLLRGVLLAGICLLLARPVADFYQEQMLRDILPVVALTAIFAGAASIRMFTVNRQLLLGRLTALELGTQFLGIVVMIGGAVILESVWALVIGGLVQSASRAFLSHVVLPGEQDRFRLEPAAFSELFHFGKWIFLSTIAGFLLKHGDRAILGKYITLTELAFYNIAFMLATLPYMLKTTLIRRILFPLYCNKPPAENPKNRNQILKARWLLTGSSFALSVPLIVFGQDLVELLYDPRYYAAGSIVTAIGFVWLFRILTAGHDPVLLAAGESRAFAVFLVLSAVVRTGLMVGGVILYGIPGVIGAALLAEVLVYPVLLALTRRYGAWDWRHDAGFALAAVAILALAFLWEPGLWNDFMALSMQSDG
jgi:O-antigen/teichoic acid export membrane protein